jgi:hypothetical protein
MSSISARRRAARLGAGLAALVLLAGCGHGARVPAAAGTTTTVAPATTLSRPATFPLTGLRAANPAAASRPALSIKVENTPPARPQAGLDAADLVTEELVEGGITRFLATFQSRDAAAVGPVRSARPVDAALLRQLGGGLFGYAGAAAGEIAPVKASSTTVLVGFEQAPDAYYRVASRPAPHNRYTSTGGRYRAAARLGAHPGPPPALFRFSARPPQGRRVQLVAVPFSPVPDYTASWRWDAKGRLWDRLQGGRPAVVAGGAPITATNVVVLRVRVGTIPGTGRLPRQPRPQRHRRRPGRLLGAPGRPGRPGHLGTPLDRPGDATDRPGRAGRPAPPGPDVGGAGAGRLQPPARLSAGAARAYSRTT